MTRMMLVAVLLAGTAGSARAELVVNGGFETGDLSGWTAWGATDATSVGGAVDGVGPAAGAAQAAFGPATLGGVAQDLATEAGRGYRLRFSLANTGLAPNRLLVSVGGVDLFDELDFDQFDHGAFSFAFTAAGATTQAAFGFVNPGGYFLLDDVSVVEAPAPAALALLGLGLARLAARRRAR